MSNSKVFCIGFNKTGTTSLEKLFIDSGYTTADQRKGEKLLYAWQKRDFSPLRDFCKESNFFQDVPFSLPYTFQALDYFFPNSKFILTIRNDSDQWFDSLQRYHRKLFNLPNRPSSVDIAAVSYVRKGWLYNYLKGVFHPHDNFFYDRDLYKNEYERHNQSVIEHFSNRPEQLLILNVADKGAKEALDLFLGQPLHGDSIEWLNKSS